MYHCMTPSQLKSCILLSDFNVDLLVNNQLSSELNAMLSSFHFTQVVGEPTDSPRIQSH